MTQVLISYLVEQALCIQNSFVLEGRLCSEAEVGSNVGQGWLDPDEYAG
jgi:hypothetical protein